MSRALRATLSITLLAAACESKASSVAPAPAVDAGAVRSRIGATRARAGEELDAVKKAAQDATPELDATQKSGVNE